jgi:hypothetical protein
VDLFRIDVFFIAMSFNPLVGSIATGRTKNKKWAFQNKEKLDEL